MSPRPQRPRAALALGLSLAAATSLACPEQPRDDPVAAVEAFLDDLGARRAEAAWRRLTDADRAELVARQRALAEAKGEVPDPSPGAAFEALGLALTKKPDNATLASRPGDAVRVRVNTEKGKSATFGAVRGSDGQWRVQLLDALEPLTGTSTGGVDRGSASP